MAETVSPQAVFDAWKKQMKQSTQAWARAVAGGGHAADPLQMWRPFMEQATQAFGAMGSPQMGPSADFAAQWKALMDQWLSAWDQVLTKAMNSEEFAQALSAHLDQWLSVQAPLRKATTESRDATLEALGVASRDQGGGHRAADDGPGRPPGRDRARDQDALDQAGRCEPWTDGDGAEAGRRRTRKGAHAEAEGGA